MATRLGHINDAIEDDPPSAEDQNSRANVLASQLNIAPLGVGVFPLPTVNSFKVTASTGLSVSIAAGSGFVLHSTIGYVAMAKGSATTLGSLVDGADNYIFASVEDATNKTYESGLPLFIADDIDTLDGGLLLAKVTTAAGAVTGVVDLRRMITPVNNRGTYVATMPYKINDIVKHSGSWWLALADSTGTTPTEGATWTALGSDGTTLAAHIANTSNPHAVTKAQVGLSNVDNTADASKPVSTAQQAAIDAARAGLSLKDPVRAATTANITLSGAQTIDGVSVIAGDRVLVKDQSTGSENGIYVCAAGAWARATDADSSAEVPTGTSVWVSEGTANADKRFTLATNAPITLNTTALTFTQDSATPSSTLSHNHTSSAGDGGPLTADEHDSFSEYSNISTPSTPAAGKVRVYAKGGGFYAIDETGVEVDMTDTAGGRVSIDVSGSSDYTLATWQRGRRTIVFTGTLTGDIDVIVPTAERHWQFVNTTSGAFTLTVKTAAGTGVEVPQGTSRLLAADGTNVVRLIQTADLPAGTIDSNQSANTVKAGPTSGGAAAPAYRALVAADLPTANRTRTINFVIDGGGVAITAGIKGDIVMDFACTIQSVTMLADQSGSVVVDIWKDSYANFAPTDADSITASAPATISAATKSQDSTLTGWTTTISAGDILRFNVDSAATITRATVSLKVLV